MVLHLGQDTVVLDSEVVGIFDLETTTISPITRKFLSMATKEKGVINVTLEMPKSFIVCSKNKDTKIYISQLSTNTLRKRSKEKDINV